MSNVFDPFVHEGDHRRRFVPRLLPEVGFEDALESEGENRTVAMKRETKAFQWFLVGIGIIFLVLVGRSIDLQIMKHEAYQQLADGNRNRIIPILAPRGIIYDRYGHALVKNIPSYDAVVVPVDLPKKHDEREATIAQAAKLLSLKKDEVDAIISKADELSFQPVLLKENIDRDTALLIDAKSSVLPGIHMETTSIREYPYNDLGSHFLGYVGKISDEEYKQKKSEAKSYLKTDSIGKSGLEQSYEDLLRGEHGKKQVEVDSRGRVTKTLATEEAKSGKNIISSIDIELQKKLQDELQRAADAAHVKRASAVALEPSTGEVLAMVSLPSFNNNIFSKKLDSATYKKLLEDPDKPLFNKATAGVFPPGSTFKPFVAAAALQEGIITPSTTVVSTGKISVGAFNFFDYDLGGHGVTDLNKAIAKSVNTYFYYIGGGYNNFPGLGINRLADYTSRFGFGSYTGIDISSESKGNIPTPEWKQSVRNEAWYIGDTYNASIGQGDVSVTPLQLADAYATIANGGKELKPHFFRTAFDNDPTRAEVKKPEEVRDTGIASEHIQSLKRALRETVLTGSGRSLEPLGIEAGGKTGTAQFVIPNSGGKKGEHAWFASFAPVSNPKIVLIVLVEGAGEGHQHAVPVAREVLKWYFSRGEIKNEWKKHE